MVVILLRIKYVWKARNPNIANSKAAAIMNVIMIMDRPPDVSESDPPKGSATACIASFQDVIMKNKSTMNKCKRKR
jgi:hypothetical protein